MSCLLRLACGLCFTLAAFAQSAGWSYYGGDAGGTRYSPAKQISAANISRLKVAWTYHTGALQPETALNREAAFEATPILVDGALYISTPFDQVIALDPATGAQRWRYDPKIDRSKNYSEVTSRGVAAWKGARTKQTRIFIGTIDARLIALDAKTGKLCPDFGSAGQIDLTRDVKLRDRGDYQVTSPPAILGDVVIVGSSIGDNRAADVERGIIRGFNARTGKLVWTWDPTPWAERNSPRTGAANAWSAMSLDPKLGFVFIPTGSASPDYYGGLRPGDNRDADSVVALQASTGKLVWSFQAVHHDLWDYDVPAQPALIVYRGKPAVAVTTKMGNVFILDRSTGRPLIPVEECPVPKSDVPGEKAWPTQPFSSLPALVPQKLTPADAWGANDKDRAWCRDKFKSLRTGAIFTPPSVQGTVSFPGSIGGVNWGSAAFDPQRHLLIADTNRVAYEARLIPRARLKAEYTAAHNRISGEFALQTGTPYGMFRDAILSPGRLPCNPPPWGTVSALDLASGKILWETPLGSMVAGANYGSPNLGGPIVTAGGLVFSAAAMDTYLRAFDIQTGREIWKANLPASAQATPMSYTVAGKQYIVICAGGSGKLGTKMGDSVVAFALN